MNDDNNDDVYWIDATFQICRRSSIKSERMQCGWVEMQVPKDILSTYMKQELRIIVFKLKTYRFGPPDASGVPKCWVVSELQEGSLRRYR